MFRGDFCPPKFASGAACELSFQGFDPLLLSDQFFSLSLPIGAWTKTHKVCSNLQCPSS